MPCSKNQLQLGGEDKFLRITTEETEIWQQHHANLGPIYDARNEHSYG